MEDPYEQEFVGSLFTQMQHLFVVITRLHTKKICGEKKLM